MLGEVARDGRSVAPTAAPTGERAERRPGSADRRRSDREGDRWWPLGSRRRPTGAGRFGLLGAEPRRDTPGRRREWHAAWAALERWPTTTAAVTTATAPRSAPAASTPVTLAVRSATAACW
jgi:hypothetical protein